MIAQSDKRLRLPTIKMRLPELGCEWMTLAGRCASQPSQYVSRRWLCGAHAAVLMERRQLKRSA